ncbi:hypothetical protein QM012_009181 [Aureobasidium pullulans]|uniref:Ubiquitin-like protease family profile domain-containing protein n=1 Tax=Aureobasidium pullulans TaxID=5580 RepID=A0ABR0THL0_AURPU
MPELYIAVYQPIEGNHYHWALFLDCKNPRVYEVAGSHPNFFRNVLQTRPQRSNRFRINVKVADVNDQDLGGIDDFMKRQEVANDTALWNCQDYVIEALETLCQECLIDEDDEVYQEGIDEAKRKYYGPLI